MNPIKPDHYKGNRFEAIDIIEDYELNFHLGNVIKYVLRAGKKGSELEDLKKAQVYLKRKIALVEQVEPDEKNLDEESIIKHIKQLTYEDRIRNADERELW